MTESRHERLTRVFLAAVDLDGEDREAYLAEACAGDGELRRDVEELLALDPDAPARLSITSAGEALVEQLPLMVHYMDEVSRPKRVGEFDILEVIEEGGMGVVYRAQQRSPNREVALKLLRPHNPSREALRRFEYEVSVLGRLQHPGIARIFQAGHAQTPSGPRPFFAMELVIGQKLLHHAREKQLDTAARLELIRSICDAVHHAHQKGVVHRDLKPDNILVDTRGKPRVLDFGVARSTNADLQTATLQTSAGKLVGTLQYMSPEQAAAEADEIDTRSDVYSLGVVIYELLTGRLPYDVDDKPPASVQRIIMESDPIPLSAADPALGGDLEWIVHKALEKEKHRRYQSAMELASDLGRFLDQRPVQARPPSNAYLLSRFVRRNRVLVGGGVATVVALIIGLLGTGLALQRAWTSEEAALAVSEEARRAEAEVRRQRDRILGLADLRVIQELTAEADNLWPCRPEQAGRMQRWLDRARDVLANLEQHERYLGELRQAGAETQAGGWIFEDRKTQWFHDNLARLVTELHDLESSDSEADLFSDIQARLARARSIEEQTVGQFADEWQDAIDDIAGSGLYDGLQLSPQVGLVPLTVNADSGLWEFWLWESGEEPNALDESGWQMTAETGLVMVLVPAGQRLLGAQSRNPRQPNYDPHASSTDSPVHESSLPPCFVSKYEMTQGQWLRLTGVNPSHFTPRTFTGVTLAHPVESVSWEGCRQQLTRWGLTLPTEDQWEFMARADTDGAWWTGPQSRSVAVAANLADQFNRRMSLGVAGFEYEDWDDGYGVHAPVGSFLANPFGIHDTMGNVWEWCLDDVSEDAESALGNPLPGDDEHEFRLLRGGSYEDSAMYCRASSRLRIPTTNGMSTLGLRPVRRLDPEE